MVRRRRGNPQREQFWREAVAAWQKSGMSIRAFCTSRALGEPSFYFWRRELQKRGLQQPAARRPVLVPLRVVPEAFLEVVLPLGVVVRVPAGADACAVATLVAALRTASC